LQHIIRVFSLFVPLDSSGGKDAIPSPASIQTSTGSVVRGTLSSNLHPRPCVIAIPTWCAWYFLLGTLNLKPVEIYGPFTCPWTLHAATIVPACTWFLWTDFPQNGSALWAATAPLVVIIHGHPLDLESLSPDLFE
jgi:hypothetical protein